MAGRLWTVGHSNRSIERLIEILASASIEQVADVRRLPASRAHPHFAREALDARLGEAGIGYRHFPGLGGRRRRRRYDSPNTGWRVAAFNAYADHMATPEYQAALDELLALARSRPTVILCAEAVPWRCHRRLIADSAAVRAREVLDILDAGQIRPHVLTPFARVNGQQLTYPGGETLFDI